jgi:hypothetical protein
MTIPPNHAALEVKERQSFKIKELSDALIKAGLLSLDEQATALGLCRSTTWTILKVKHKNYGLSGSVINRILKKRRLDRRVRAKLIEYVQEKASGYYGHNKTQLRRFKESLSARVLNEVYEFKTATNAAADSDPEKNAIGQPIFEHESSVQS